MTKKKTNKNANKNTTLDIVLDGQVLLVEKTKSGKVVSTEEVDGRAVLQAILTVVTSAAKHKLNIIELKDKSKKTLASPWTGQKIKNGK